MKSDKKIVMTAVKHSWDELKYRSKDNLRDSYIVMAAVKQNWWVLEFVS